MQQEQVYQGAKGTLGALSEVPSAEQLPSTSARLEVSKIGEGAGEHQLHSVPTMSVGWCSSVGIAVGQRYPRPPSRCERGGCGSAALAPAHCPLPKQPRGWSLAVAPAAWIRPGLALLLHQVF